MFGTKKMINHTAKIDDSRLEFLKVAKSGEFSGRYGFRYWWVGKFHGDTHCTTQTTILTSICENLCNPNIMVFPPVSLQPK